MALKISLKPHERMIIGGAVVKNGNKVVDLFIENNVSILREKDIINEAGANTPCKRIYFIIQLMYIDGGKSADYQNSYEDLVRELVAAAPSTAALVAQINESISAGKLYPALKLAHQLIDYEDLLIKLAEPVTE
ncbi:MAG: flagellar biosynthesis repressor FlbT [Desulfuromonadaceae bacterium]|nr:flagellar biosynthesis repressor FlbT [Desulfuromonadaceae bacterium]